MPAAEPPRRVWVGWVVPSLDHNHRLHIQEYELVRRNDSSVTVLDHGRQKVIRTGHFFFTPEALEAWHFQWLEKRMACLRQQVRQLESLFMLPDRGLFTATPQLPPAVTAVPAQRPAEWDNPNIILD